MALQQGTRVEAQMNGLAANYADVTGNFRMVSTARLGANLPRQCLSTQRELSQHLITAAEKAAAVSSSARRSLPMRRMFPMTRPFLRERFTAAISITAHVHTAARMTTCLEENVQLGESYEFD